MNKASYRYQVSYKHRNSLNIHEFVTGYVPAGLKMSQIQKYIQGRAQDKKIIGITKLTQRYYYSEVDQVGSNGEIDVTDEELYAVQVKITQEEAAKAKLAAEQAKKEAEEAAARDTDDAERVSHEEAFGEDNATDE